MSNLVDLSGERSPRARDEALMQRKRQVLASQRLLTKPQVADIFGVSPRTVNRWVAGRKLKAIRLGNVLRFDPKEVERFKEKATDR